MKYRRTKHAELTTLQAAHDSLSQSNDAAQASLKALQNAHSNQAHQLTQALTKVQDLTGQLAEQETKFANEANGLKRLVAMMEEREKQAKDIVENLEDEWAGVGQKAEQRESVLKDEIEKERRGREDAEKRIRNLEAVVEGMGRGDLPLPGRGSLPGTPLRTPGANGDPFNDSMVGLSPTIAMASRAQKGGKSFTDIYTDYVKLKEDYTKKVIEYDNMDRTLQSVLAQIQERVRLAHISNLYSSNFDSRRQFFHSSGPNINVYKTSLRSLPNSCPQSLLNEMRRPMLFERLRRNSPKSQLRISFSNNN